MMRRIAVIAAAITFGIVLVPVLVRLPSHYRGPYGDAVVPASLDLRHVANVVGSVAYDIRGFDTLGEELILFASVIGVSVLLRARGERHPKTRGIDRAEAFARPGNASRPAVHRASANVLAIAIVFGLYMTLHATQSPGGGFQGGAIVASAIVLVYLGAGYKTWADAIPETAFDVGESSGVAIFVILAALPMLWGRTLLANWLPIGTLGKFASGGVMFVVNLAIAAAVASGFVLLAASLLHDLHESEEALDQDDRQERK